jgi:hypothetical protein
MNRYTIYFKQLPYSVKLSTNIYIGCVIGYNIGKSWIGAKNKLIEYRENKLTYHEKENIKSEWCALKYGADEFLAKNFFESIIWPVITIPNIIPFMVLLCNPRK